MSEEKRRWWYLSLGNMILWRERLESGIIYMEQIEIEEKGIIRKQAISFQNDVSIIYGVNNCGKTTLLKQINLQLDKRLRRSVIDEKEVQISLYLPTNRLMVNKRFTKEYQIHDREELLNYKIDMYEDFALHLNILRENLFHNCYIHNFVIKAVNEMFNTQIEVYEMRYSDGIEDIINIYLNVIWILIWDENYNNLTDERLKQLISERSAYVLIDEIEMFLHVNIQDKLIQHLKKDFPKCIFVFTTHSPLLLTRYKNISIYNLTNGYLEHVVSDSYFADLDHVYESLFGVKELPEDAKTIIDYFGEIIMHEKEPEGEKVTEYVNYLEDRYPNIAQKYNKYLVKAELLVDDE